MHLPDVFPNAIRDEELSRFQAAALGSADELDDAIVQDAGIRVTNASEGLVPVSRQEDLRFIKSQQNGLSREKERMIQGIQSQAQLGITSDSDAVQDVLSGFGEDINIPIIVDKAAPSASIRFAPSTLFLQAAKMLTDFYT